MKIKALIIDDERKAIALLKSRLNQYCPNIIIVGETENPLEGLALIEKLNPEIVFLDIAMPEMSGFDLLARVENPNFELIFVTAFDEYAIDAIRHCAIGYILKPINIQSLIEAVEHAATNIETKTALQKNKHFIENIGHQTFRKKKIAIAMSDGLEFISIANIVHCEGSDGYTKIHVLNGKQKLSSNSIGHFTKLLSNQDFYLVHKSHLINLEHIKKYQYDGSLMLIDGTSIPVSFNRRKAFRDFLKNRDMV